MLKVFFSVNSADRSDCNTLERLCTFPTIHDQVFLQTRPWRSLPLVAPLPAGSNRAKNIQILVPLWGFPLSTKPRQSPYVLWLHWKLLNSETWQTSLISGQPSSTKYPLVDSTTIPPRRKLSFILKGVLRRKVRSRELSYLENFEPFEPPNGT